MIFILNKVRIFFVIAVILIPSFVEAIDLSGVKVLSKFVDCPFVLGEFLEKESHEFKEVLMAIYNPLFGWFKGGNELFASPVAEQSSDSTAFSEITPEPNKDSDTCNNKASSDPGIGYYIFHIIGYLSIVTAIYHVHWLERYERDMFFDIWSHFDDLKHNDQLRHNRRKRAWPAMMMFEFS